ncbi:myb/SANT-like DNA-binding domain-containing protein 3 [Cylas formicarius]|uniref:myb/SANT-like DNA-binding domain-containing protein 3 n=1 Tax=Cylas formicarius TaxID=197179 RepID=UPI0029586708|nr:myb/SANT-like DNA-binding domain-containing protein 3 [Cylas formicarius]
MAVPYTREDKEVLVQIIKKYHIIEDKRTDASTIKKKNAAWASVTDDFNASRTTEKRTSVQLKRCWDKIKRKRKEELAEERRSRMLTGGGESMPDKILIPGVDEVVPHLTEHVENPFDSDGKFESAEKDYTILDISEPSHTITKDQSSLPEDNNAPSTSSTIQIKSVSLASREIEVPTPLSSDSISRKRLYPDEKKILQNITKQKDKVVFAKSNGDLNALFKERIVNAKLERQHLIDIHEINKQEAIEKREEAKIRRQIAEVELSIKREELRQLLLKND